ncbi:hypothetical protein GEV33_012200 [Tenebrio molitor]|uniref:Uncharacterized protein n=2 Tax=Tenebrio molitor TaxID=7067 RepID=A0A8J6L7G7_TENMO|nr:hypothetical protein GEV33_012200 [Tenebrio molitor]
MGDDTVRWSSKGGHRDIPVPPSSTRDRYKYVQDGHIRQTHVVNEQIMKYLALLLVVAAVVLAEEQQVKRTAKRGAIGYGYGGYGSYGLGYGYGHYPYYSSYYTPVISKVGYGYGIGHGYYGGYYPYYSGYHGYGGYGGYGGYYGGYDW